MKAHTVEQLEKANGELREFSARIAHDLRAPIASSQGMISIATEALDEEDYEQARFGVMRVGKAMKRLDALIGDVQQIMRNRPVSVDRQQL